MQFSRHVHITGTALKQWFIGQCYDSACVGLLWWGGLTLLQVPFAIFWALLATLFQFIPHFGPPLSIIGPLIAAAFVALFRFCRGWPMSESSSECGPGRAPICKEVIRAVRLILTFRFSE